MRRDNSMARRDIALRQGTPIDNGHVRTNILRSRSRRWQLTGDMETKFISEPGDGFGEPDWLDRASACKLRPAKHTTKEPVSRS
jgi:hypothetical protein